MKNNNSNNILWYSDFCDMVWKPNIAHHGICLFIFWSIWKQFISLFPFSKLCNCCCSLDELSFLFFSHLILSIRSVHINLPGVFPDKRNRYSKLQNACTKKKHKNDDMQAQKTI